MLIQPEYRSRGRHVLWLLPVIVILAGLLAWQNSRTVGDVAAEAETLVDYHIPDLKEIVSLQSVINRLIIALHESYAEATVPAAVQTAELEQAYRVHLFNLQGGDDGGRAERLNAEIGGFSRAAVEFGREMAKGADRDWDALRRHLAAADKHAKVAEVLLATWHEDIRHRVTAGGERTRDKIATLLTVQLAFSGALLVGALLLAATLYRRNRDQQRLFESAFFDPLTGLPNQRSLERLGRDIGRADDASLVVIWLSLDRIALIGSTFGQQTGDEVVRCFSDELAGELNALPFDLSLFTLLKANWVICLQGEAAVARHTEVIACIRALTRHPLTVEGREFNVASSIGAACAPEHGQDLPTLLRNADTARRAVHQSGGDGVRLYESLMTNAAEQILTLEAGMRRTLADGGFELYFQPQIAATDGRVASAEVLLRWRDGDRQISPAIFIPVAEQTGLIAQLGDWVLTEACRQWVSWRDAGLDPPPIAVNVSVQQFESATFAERVGQVLRESGMPPGQLELEVTEQAATESPEKVVEVIRQLKQIGVTIALDDFGTGYSSLSYLKRFPIDVLKVDRAFVSQLEVSDSDRAIVTMIVRLGTQLGFEVVAEGVETPQQSDLLVALGCDLLQGFMYSKPLPADDYVAYLKAQPWRREAGDTADAAAAIAADASALTGPAT